MNVLAGTGTAPRVFASGITPPDPDALDALARGTRDADLAAPPVVLPDFLHKDQMEMPSSIAVATRSTIRPSFTASSLNCGMALMALDVDVPGERATVALLDAIRSAHPWPPGLRRSLDTRDVLAAATEGARFAVERFGVDARALERIEEHGRMSLEPYGGVASIREEIPWLTRVLSGMRFASIGPSNHFIELQRVEEILEPATAARLGVEHGQVTLQYHGGGGVLAGQIGRLYARRRKVPRSVRVVMAVQKPRHHLATARSVAQARERLGLYFRHAAAIPRHGREGRRVMLAHAAAMNFGFAFRMAIYASLARIAGGTLGARDATLIVDSPHNSIYEEDGAIIHRHNTCRAWPAERFAPGTTFGDTGQALLLPGTSRTSSFLCVADAGAEASLFSACHGSGGIISDLEARGLSGPDPAGRHTIRLRYDTTGPTAVPQLDDRGVNEALSILTDHRIVRPVARMRPLGVLH